MRGLWIGLALALVAPPASAQGQRRAPLAASAASAPTQQERDGCYSPTATDDQRIDGCTALIQSAQATPTTKAGAYTNRGSAYKNKGLLDQAIADETQSLALNPNEPATYNTRGIAYYGKGLLDQAIADYTQAIALKADFAMAYENRGVAYERKGSRELAIADYRASLRLDPSRKLAPDGLKRLGATP
jgi:tetratricopeptide (TPR) repeat protein